MKQLEIILPFYNEDIETIQPMLSSINNQLALLANSLQYL